MQLDDERQKRSAQFVQQPIDEFSQQPSQFIPQQQQSQFFAQQPQQFPFQQQQQLPLPQPARNPFQQQQQPFVAPFQQSVPNFNQQQQQVFVPFSQQQAPLRAQPSNDQPEPDLSSDTRVNDLLSDNARRGGLVRIEPESELIRRDPVTGLIVPDEGGNVIRPIIQQSLF